mmetsp:Transcript_129493/g.362510  ORF Transcript_129493/g.362510 Transcript_129493/m.362510 type:complete len:276 (+) Transcript_129493:346-1173(+)
MQRNATATVATWPTHGSHRPRPGALAALGGGQSPSAPSAVISPTPAAACAVRLDAGTRAACKGRQMSRVMICDATLSTESAVDMTAAMLATIMMEPMSLPEPPCPTMSRTTRLNASFGSKRAGRRARATSPKKSMGTCTRKGATARMALPIRNESCDSAAMARCAKSGRSARWMPRPIQSSAQSRQSRWRGTRTWPSASWAVIPGSPPYDVSITNNMSKDPTTSTTPCTTSVNTTARRPPNISKMLSSPARPKAPCKTVTLPPLIVLISLPKASS